MREFRFVSGKIGSCSLSIFDGHTRKNYCKEQNYIDNSYNTITSYEETLPKNNIGKKKLDCNKSQIRATPQQPEPLNTYKKICKNNRDLEGYIVVLL